MPTTHTYIVVRNNQTTEIFVAKSTDWSKLISESDHSILFESNQSECENYINNLKRKN